jgi:hypothetical protein
MEVCHAFQWSVSRRLAVSADRLHRRGQRAIRPIGPLNTQPGPRVDINAVRHDTAFVMQAGITGVLRLSNNGCLYAYHRKTRFSPAIKTDLVWPEGTTVLKDEAGTPVVVDDHGVVVAMVGHSLLGLGGGSVAARRASDITCRLHQKGPLFYVQGDMPSLSNRD